MPNCALIKLNFPASAPGATCRPHAEKSRTAMFPVELVLQVASRSGISIASMGTVAAGEEVTYTSHRRLWP